MSPSKKMRARAYEVAAELLAADMENEMELTSDLSQEEDEEIRKFIQTQIIRTLKSCAKGSRLVARTRPRLKSVSAKRKKKEH